MVHTSRGVPMSRRSHDAGRATQGRPHQQRRRPLVPLNAVGAGLPGALVVIGGQLCLVAGGARGDKSSGGGL